MPTPTVDESVLFGLFRNHAELCGTVRAFPLPACRTFALSFGKIPILARKEPYLEA